MVKAEMPQLTDDIWIKLFGAVNWPTRLRLERVCKRFQNILSVTFQNLGVVDVNAWRIQSRIDRRDCDYQGIYHVLTKLVERGKIMKGLRCEAINDGFDVYWIKSLLKVLHTRQLERFHEFHIDDVRVMTPWLFTSTTLHRMSYLKKLTISLPTPDRFIDLQRMECLEEIDIKRIIPIKFAHKSLHCFALSDAKYKPSGHRGDTSPVQMAQFYLSLRECETQLKRVKLINNDLSLVETKIDMTYQFPMMEHLEMYNKSMPILIDFTQSTRMQTLSIAVGLLQRMPSIGTVRGLRSLQLNDHFEPDLRQEGMEVLEPLMCSNLFEHFLFCHSNFELFQQVLTLLRGQAYRLRTLRFRLRDGSAVLEELSKDQSLCYLMSTIFVEANHLTNFVLGVPLTRQSLAHVLVAAGPLVSKFVLHESALWSGTLCDDLLNVFNEVSEKGPYMKRESSNMTVCFPYWLSLNHEPSECFSCTELLDRYNIRIIFPRKIVSVPLLEIPILPPV